MEIRTENNTIIEVELGAFVYDELSNTYTEWNDLEDTTQQHLESLIAIIETATDSLRQTINNHARITA